MRRIRPKGCVVERAAGRHLRRLAGVAVDVPAQEKVITVPLAIRSTVPAVATVWSVVQSICAGAVVTVAAVRVRG